MKLSPGASWTPGESQQSCHEDTWKTFRKGSGGEQLRTPALPANSQQATGGLGKSPASHLEKRILQPQSSFQRTAAHSNILLKLHWGA